MSDIIDPDRPCRESYSKQNITTDKLKKFLPKGTRHEVTDEIIAVINNMEEDVGVVQEYMEETFLGNINVLKEHRISIEEYIRAVKYVALKQNMDKTKAWAIVFPEKYDELMRKKAAGQLVNEFNYASMYDQTKAVVKLTSQTLLAPSITHASHNREALDKMYKLMNGIDAQNSGRVSAKVQLDAAVALFDATKVPEDNTLTVNIAQSDAQLEQQKAMNENIARLVANQQAAFRRGDNTAKLQQVHVDVIDAEVSDVS